jgi:glycosyltransferase involved in cell wall biosynthesis
MQAVLSGIVADHSEAPDVDFTLLVCTYNRAGDLEELLETALAQDTNGEFSYEVVVVDNNSTDRTREVVSSFNAQHRDRLHYLFERRQGKSHALNTGLAAMHGRYYAIVDDDFLLPRDWLLRIADAFRRHPDAAFVSGKVLPRWEADPPAWLTREHWSALALADYGDVEFRADAARDLCLLACIFRVDAVRAVGGYDVLLGVRGDRIGGVEDLDILRRLWAAGYHGVYVPTIWFHHKVAGSRLTKAYHRRWHRGHGRSRATMRSDDEQRLRHLAGVPRYMFREALSMGVLAPLRYLVGRTSEAFTAETRFWFIVGYVAERWKGALQKHLDKSGSPLLSRP